MGEEENRYFSFLRPALALRRARLTLAHADVFQKNEKENKTSDLCVQAIINDTFEDILFLTYIPRFEQLNQRTESYPDC